MLLPIWHDKYSQYAFHSYELLYLKTQQQSLLVTGWHLSSNSFSSDFIINLQITTCHCTVPCKRRLGGYLTYYCLESRNSLKQTYFILWNFSFIITCKNICTYDFHWKIHPSNSNLSHKISNVQQHMISWLSSFKYKSEITGCYPFLHKSLAIQETNLP